MKTATKYEIRRTVRTSMLPSPRWESWNAISRCQTSCALFVDGKCAWNKAATTDGGPCVAWPHGASTRSNGMRERPTDHAATKETPMKTILQLLALFWALLFFAVPARADTARLLDHLCQRPDLAPVIDRAAARHHVSALRLAVLMASESRCRGDAVNVATGALGLFQILPSGSANPQHMEPDELLAPDVNADLGAAHLSRLLRLCGSFGGALTIYHGRRHCSDWRNDGHVKRVLGIERALLKWLYGPKYFRRVG